MSTLPPPVGPPGPPSYPPPGPPPAKRSNTVWIIVAVGLALFCVLPVGCVGAVTVLGKSTTTTVAAAQATTRPTTTSTVADASPPATAGASLSSRMTKNSGVHDVPLPDDATPTGSTGTVFKTNAASLPELTAWYQDYMRQKGWTFDPKHSTLDPAVAATKQLGYTSNQFWCMTQPTGNLPGVYIIVGGHASDPASSSVEVSVSADDGEESCP